MATSNSRAVVSSAAESRAELSLIIPCYNEIGNLAPLLERCESLLGRCSAEVILVDNGSSDGTWDFLRKACSLNPGLRPVRVDVNQGYGAGIKTGLAAAGGHVVGWTHADLQTDPCDAVIGLDLFREAPDSESTFVKGERHGRPLTDRVFTLGMSLFETLLFRTRLRDINAQPTLFSRAFLREMNGAPDDFSLDLFALYRASVTGMDIQRFPVRFGARAFGESHWNTGVKARAGFVRRTVEYSLDLRRGA